jgi:hypothetical protein
MNRKLEDELLQAAFGDLSPDEEARIAREASADPEAAKTYALYTDMKEGLKSMRDLPEHQLSTDRLRHAILQQGLKPKRTGWGLGWTLFPAAAAAATVLGYLAMTKQPSVDGEQRPVASNTKKDKPLFENTASNKAPNIERPDNWMSFEQTPFGEDPTIGTDVSVRSAGNRRSRSGSGIRLVARNTEPIRVSDEVYGPPVPPTPTNINAGGGARTANASAGPAVVNTDPGIVVIENDRDRETGANRAKEVDSAKNVVIGG